MNFCNLIYNMSFFLFIVSIVHVFVYVDLLSFVLSCLQLCMFMAYLYVYCMLIISCDLSYAPYVLFSHLRSTFSSSILVILIFTIFMIMFNMLIFAFDNLILISTTVHAHVRYHRIRFRYAHDNFQYFYRIIKIQVFQVLQFDL